MNTWMYNLSPTYIILSVQNILPNIVCVLPWESMVLSHGKGSVCYSFYSLILPAAVWPRIDSASNRNEYQKYFLGVKADGA